ncbi:MAG: 4Fe-4S dicluster domain-containing protein [Candidatus Jordarchaeales archaeon]|nr:4Fe-4S dicluster domain-containing protein [Candidatus Jordarchaeia archaeon]
MAGEDLYELLRQTMNRGALIKLPKHRAVYDMLKAIFSEEEARLLTAFEKPNKPLSAGMIAQLSGLHESEVVRLLDDMAFKGKLLKVGGFYVLLPFIPGLFEVYFTHNRDEPERMAKAAKAYRELFYSGHPFELSAGKHPIYRVIPAVEPVKKTIEINKALGLERQVLPYEVLEEYLSKANLFAVVPCSCRNAAKHAGEPCKRTEENFCVAVGLLAQSVLDQGIGRQVSFEELMELMRRAEREGLVHETINIQETAAFICNCCPCCCGFLKSVKELRNYGAICKSNFAPIIDGGLCKRCEKCMEICPMDAIYHHYPHSEDLSDDMMVVRYDLCIGCGLCASNCPNGAVSLKKVRDSVPFRNQAEMEEQVRVGRTH